MTLTLWRPGPRRNNDYWFVWSLTEDNLVQRCPKLELYNPIVEDICLLTRVASIPIRHIFIPVLHTFNLTLSFAILIVVQHNQ